MADDSSSGGGGLLKNAQGWVALMAAVITAWGAWITIQINQINSSIQRNTAERNWTAVVFDKYSDAITREKLEPAQRIAALNGLLNLTDLIERDALRTKMRKVILEQLEAYNRQLLQLATTQTGAVKAQTVALAAQAGAIADAATTKVNQTVGQAGSNGTGTSKQAAKLKWGNFDFDIFYCQGSPEAEARVLQSANAIAALKGLDPSASGRWRIRPLSIERNATLGFRISGVVIRPSTKDEALLANQMANVINQRSVIDANLGQALVKPITYPTPNYISVFVCPVSVAASPSGAPRTQ